MNFLPIVERELRVTARRAATYRLRWLLAFAVFILWVALLIGNQRRLTPALLSQRLFVALGVLAFSFCLLAGLLFTADCLSSEKRNGTLGFLFLTDLKGYDVVLGKLAATSLHAFYGLLGILPILALPLLMGGVSPGEFGRLIIALLAILVQSLGLSILVSAISREIRQALLGSFLITLLVAALLPCLYWLQFLWLRNWLGSFLLAPSPSYAFQMVFDTYYRLRGGVSQYWWSVALVFSSGLIALGFACGLLARVWREHVPALANRRRLFRWQAKRFGDMAWRKELREREMENNPYGWLSLRDQLVRGLTGSLFLVILPLWGSCLLGSLADPRSRNMRILFLICLFTAYGLHQLVKLIVAMEASRQISEDRHNGMLELLLTTPLPLPWIWLGIRGALKQHFKAAFQWLTLINWLLISAAILFHERLDLGHDDRIIFIELFVGGWIMLYLDGWALTWTGMAAALKDKHHHRAILKALGKIMGPPWIAIFLMVFLNLNRGWSADTFKAVFALWFMFGVMNDGIAGWRARQYLEQNFRKTVAQNS